MAQTSEFLLDKSNLQHLKQVIPILEQVKQFAKQVMVSFHLVNEACH